MTRLTPTQRVYREYLRSPQWRRTRARILARADDHCEWCDRFCGPNPHPWLRFCGGRDTCEWCRFYFDDEGNDTELERQRLDVHHTTYVRLGHERDEDLVALCWICHDEVTDRYLMLRDMARAGRIAREDATPEAAATRFWPTILKVMFPKKGSS